MNKLTGYVQTAEAAEILGVAQNTLRKWAGRGDISIYGQESNSTTRRLAVTNLVLRGIEADLGPVHADTFRRDRHKDVRADYMLANLPFNDSDWHRRYEGFRPLTKSYLTVNAALVAHEHHHVR